MIVRLANRLYDLLDGLRGIDFLGPLALRLYLAPVFWVAGMNKVTGFGNVIDWFGNPDWGLGLPAPALLAVLAVSSELAGALFLLVGFAIRLIVIPLLVTMLVAAAAVHWENGWQAVHDPQSPYASEFTFGIEADDAAAASERLTRAKSILREHGNYDWLTSKGSYVISNSGIEWAATYFVMLLALFFTGAGRIVSIDYWLAQRLRRVSGGPTDT